MEHDAWTTVTAKGRKKREASAVKVNPKNPPSRTTTLAQIQADFNGKMKAWHASECRKTTLSILDRIQPEDGWDLRKAVCVGSGSFSRDNMECRKRSLWQFMIFVDLARELQKRTREKMDVELFAQEPEFTDLDRSLLSTLNVTVLEIRSTASGTLQGAATSGIGPAREHLGHDAFLYEPFMDMDAQMAREIIGADPGLYIGSSMKGLLTKRGELGELAKRYNQEHEKYQFPRFEEDANVLEGLEIYWKPEMDEGE